MTRTRAVRVGVATTPWVVVGPSPAGGVGAGVGAGVGVADGAAVGVGVGAAACGVVDAVGDRAVGRWRRYNMGEAVALVVRLTASSAAGWLLVVTTDAA